MNLNDQENILFEKIHRDLTYFVGLREKMISEETTFEEFQLLSIQEKYLIRNKLYENIHLLEDYIQEKSDRLSDEEKDVIRGFKHFQQGKFYVIKLLKKHAVFLGDKYSYAVHALNDPFEYHIGRNLPTMIQTVLLPFKGKIVYDGILSTFSIRFGGGMKKRIKNDFAKSESRYGLITTLPINAGSLVKEQDFEKELITLMKTKSSREYNWYAIQALVNRHPELMPVYRKEWGRANSRKKKKDLKELGITKQHFALYEDVIIASAKTKPELEKIVKGLVTERAKLASIFYFKL